MAKAKIQDIRNLVLCGHGSAGKTTLVDKMLFKTGAVNAQPSVDDGTSICDFDAEEKHHKYTIEATLVQFRPRRQALQRDRHARLSRFHRPDDRCHARRRHGGHRDQRPVGHRGQHAPRVRRGGQGRPGPDDHHQQDGRRQHRLSRPGRRNPGAVGQRLRAAERARRPRRRFQGRGQHAAGARGHGRRAGRSPRRSTSRCSSRSSRSTRA